jgi:hypothetical protein
MNVQSATRQQLGLWHGVIDGMVSGCAPDILQKDLDGATITSIGSIYAHAVLSEDAIVQGMLQGRPPIFQADGWEAKTGMALPAMPPEIKPEWARNFKMNLTPFQEYAKAVYAATDAYLADVPDSDLDRKIQTPIGEQTVAWAIAVLLGTHLPGHAGEIAALIGVQGKRGLPF